MTPARSAAHPTRCAGRWRVQGRPACGQHRIAARALELQPQPLRAVELLQCQHSRLPATHRRRTGGYCALLLVPVRRAAGRHQRQRLQGRSEPQMAQLQSAAGQPRPRAVAHQGSACLDRREAAGRAWVPGRNPWARPIGCRPPQRHRCCKVPPRPSGQQAGAHRSSRRRPAQSHRPKQCRSPCATAA